MKCLINTLLNFLCRNLLQVQTECDVIEYIEVREQSISLENRVDMSLMCRHLKKVRALEVYDSCISSLEACDDPECR